MSSRSSDLCSLPLLRGLSQFIRIVCVLFTLCPVDAMTPPETHSYRLPHRGEQVPSPPKWISKRQKKIDQLGRHGCRRWRRSYSGSRTFSF